MYKKPSKFKLAASKFFFVLLMLVVIALVIAAGGGSLMVLFNTLHTDVSGSVPALGYIPSTLLVGSIVAIPVVLFGAGWLLIRAVIVTVGLED